jgi:N-acetylmuramoyl-L-alanine amidase
MGKMFLFFFKSTPLKNINRYFFHRTFDVFFLTVLFVFISCLPAFAMTSLMAIRSWTAPGYTRIVFDLDRPVLFQELKTNDSRKISIEFRNCRNATSMKKCHIDWKLIESLRLINSSPNSLIIEITASESMDYHIFYLRKYESKPDRIVIDIKNPVYAQKEKETKKEIESLKKANWIVVIDPGHGGEDPGAIGKEGWKEKDIVLSVGKKLKNFFDKIPGIKAYLTRDGDYFLSLRERIEIAHKFQADLFMSLHANASLKKSTKGASVYYLSRDGATDEASALLADKENASDKIGGIPLGKDTLLDSILIDLVQTRTINESIDLGEKVLEELIKIKGLEKEGLKCANFGVLKSPSIPSVLIELAYLSNQSDIKLLGSKNYQKQMAKNICEGVSKFLFENPTKQKPKQVIAKANALEDYEIHIVRKGETLWRIATIYGIPLDIIRNLNELNSSSILLVGQKLKIPIK